MLFFTVRFSIFAILFALFMKFRKKNPILNKRRFCIIILIIFAIFSTISSLFPLENLFVTFKTPESVYKYKYSSKAQLVLNGRYSSFVIGGRNNYNSGAIDIFPKSKNGWKLSNSFKVKMIKSIYFEGTAINVYKNQDYNDYYIGIDNMNGGLLKISDNCNSKFVYIKTNYNNKVLYSYYAYIREFDKKYKVTINDKKISIR